jgi:hypothetical protein
VVHSWYEAAALAQAALEQQLGSLGTGLIGAFALRLLSSGGVDVTTLSTAREAALMDAAKRPHY